MRFKNFFGKSFIKNKKGISPLIATVLLIGFTVALAAVVITWGGGFVDRISKGTEQKATSSITCTGDVKFELKKVVCDNNGAVAGGLGTINLENKGGVDIKGIILRFFDSAGTNLGATNFDDGGPGNPSLKSYSLKTVTLENVIPAGTNKVEALATIVLDGQNVTCGDAPKSLVFSPACV